MNDTQKAALEKALSAYEEALHAGIDPDILWNKIMRKGIEVERARERSSSHSKATLQNDRPKYVYTTFDA
jgi:hypothetical protein